MAQALSDQKNFGATFAANFAVIKFSGLLSMELIKKYAFVRRGEGGGEAKPAGGESGLTHRFFYDAKALELSPDLLEPRENCRPTASTPVSETVDTPVHFHKKCRRPPPQTPFRPPRLQNPFGSPLQPVDAPSLLRIY